MDRSQLDRLLSDALIFGRGGYVVRCIDPRSFHGLPTGPAAAPSPIARTRLGVARSRPRGLRYSGAWAPRYRTTPGALRTTPRRRFGRLGRGAWRSWP